MEDLFSHPILKSCCHHVRGEELSVLKVTRNTQTRLHRVSVIKNCYKLTVLPIFTTLFSKSMCRSKLGCALLLQKMASVKGSSRSSCHEHHGRRLPATSWQIYVDMLGTPRHRVQKYKEWIIKPWDGFLLLTQHYDNIYVLLHVFIPESTVVRNIS